MRIVQSTAGDTPQTGRPIRILNVDDSADFRALVKEVLEKAHRGFQVTEASTLAEFEARLAEGDYDLVLSDFHMQDFLGLQVLDAVHARAPGMPVVILTGTGSEASAVECMKHGATDYLLKSPELMQQLPQTIRAAIEKQQLLDERAQALEALRVSEERYRGLFENAQDVIYSCDLEGNVTSLNPTAERITGYLRESALRLNVADLVAPEHLERTREMTRRKLAGEPSTTYEVDIIAKNGRRVPLEVATKVIYQHGKPVGIQGNGRDITERRRAAAALAESENRLRTIIETQPECVKLLARDGTLLEMNRAGLALIEADSIEQVIGKSVCPLVATGHHGEFNELLQAVFRGESRRLEMEIVGLKGTRRWMEMYAVPLRDPADQNNIKALLSVTRDITERRRSQEALRRTEERYRQAIIGAGAVPYLHDYQSAAYSFIGEDIKQMTGYGPQELTPELWEQISLREIMRGEAAGLTKEEAHRRTRHGELLRWQSDNLIRTRDGTQRWVADASVEILGNDGKPTGSVGILQDITERKRTELQGAAFSTLGQRLSTATTVEQAARTVVEVADKLLGWDACSLDLYFAEPDEMLPALAMDIIDGRRTDVLVGLGHSKPNAVMRRVIEEGGQLIVSRAPGTPAAELVPFGDKARLSASLMFVPIRHGGRVTGVLSIQSYTRNAYSADDLNTLQALADHCSGAMERIQAEQQYRSLFENAVEGICRTTPDGRFLAANPALARMLGFGSAGELVAAVSNFVRQLYVDPKQRDQIGALIERQDFVKGFELQLRHKDGSPLWVSLNARAIRDASGAILHYESTVQDISERKRADQQLLRLVAVVEQSTESIVITDLSGVVQYINPACERITGFPREELIGQHFDFLLQGKDVPFTFNEITEKVARAGAWTGRYGSQKKDNTKFVEEASISAVHDSEGKIINYIALNRDVTKEATLEEQVRLAQKMEAIGLLAGGVAHDFNNILQVIQGFTTLAKDGINTREDRDGYLDQVTKAATRASQLTRQLLAFGRRQPLQRVDTDVNQVVSNQLPMIQRLIAANIEVEFIPASDLDNVRADRGQLEQVLLNLCVNSRDAMPNGGRITIQSENILIGDEFLETHAWARRGHHVLLSVTDTGEGMDKETITRVFEPFFTTKPKDKGTGLGLATVYGIIKQHEGMIFVESEPGAGASFKVYLPVAERGVTGEARKTPAKPGKGTETILLAEDEQQVRALAIKILERAGYQVVVAVNGEEAVRLFKDHPGKIDMLVFDVVMPKMGGREAYDSIKTLKPEVPVLFCSGYSGTALQPGFELEASVQLLQKPYSSDALLRRIRELLVPGHK